MSHLKPFVRIAAFIAITTLALSACNFPGLQTPDPFPTYAAQTVEARLTRAVEDPPAEETSPAAPTTPAPATATNTQEAPTSTNTPIPTETEIPCNRATFVQDVTIPDGTDLEPDEDFTKTWRLRNAGSCTWDTDYELLFKDGDAMDGPASQDLSGSVAPGETVDISVDLTAPNSEGSYKGFWWLRSDAGIVFGVGSSGDVPFYVEIDVVIEETILSNGKFDLDQTWSVDFDTGDVSGTTSDTDLKFEAVTASEKYLRPFNNAEIKLMSSRTPSLADCQSASLSTTKISLDDIEEYDVFCFVTNLGNYGRFEVENITTTNPQTIRIDYLTWDT
ncbi:MAG: NBR1-Ig-like domain-containing protein [Anaerolineales bacterium]|jgi:hypothetical protein